MSFKVEFQELQLFKNTLKQFGDLKIALPDISTSIQLFHNTLERRVKTIYAVPGNLSSVMVGRSIKPSEVGNTFLRYSLQYQDKSIKLALYPHTESVVANAKVKYPKRMFNDGIKWKLKGYAIQTSVYIKRTKTEVPTRKKYTNQKGFLQHGKIYARKQKRTWDSYPTRTSEGVRAPYTELYGPTLARLAGGLFENDAVVMSAKEKVGEDILKAMTKWY